MVRATYLFALWFAASACGSSSTAGSVPGGDAVPGGDSATDGTATCGGPAVCEDFEATAVGATPGGGWTVATPSCSGTGTLAVDDTQSHGGSRSLKVSGKGGYCNHVFLANAAPSALSGTIYGRFYVRFEDVLGAGHVSFVALADRVDAKDLRLGGQSGIAMWNRELNDATLPALSPQGIALSVAPTADAWHCVEIAIDGTAGTLTTAVDGVMVSGLTIDATPTPEVDQQWLQSGPWHPQLGDVRFGWESYAGQAMNLWFDDIAIGATRIACE